MRWLGAVFAGALMWASSARADVAPIKIGVMNDMSSVYAVAGGRETVEAVRMAIDDAGPVLGKKAELIFADHQNKPDVGSAIARRWYDVEGVDAVVDVPNSAVAFAVQSLAKEKKKISLFVGALSSDVTGPKCDNYTTQWAVDTYSLAHVMGAAVLKRGGNRWFFLGADYVFGRALVRDTSAVIEANGGKVLGAVYAPLNTSDFSSFLLQAQPTNPNVIGLANSSDDTVNSIKQAVEFGLTSNGATFAAYVLFLEHVQSITLKTGHGLLLANPFYWDLNDETRAWSKRFEEKIGHPPDWDPAMSYSAVFHYLKAVNAAGSRDADAVAAKMRELPVNDFTTKDGKVRIDGRVLRNLYLLQVKKPEESKGKWDLYNVVATVPGDEAFRPLQDGGCPLVKAGSAKP
ncbi:ABC transporter substrate-binding protein [Bradyrhizobium yuanmingense]|uniref:ABC transporter substrate-binding protein n=1 Tax=Bradyrhizobium yuanmingense TaxID=108015 RepID=UPI0023B9715D|nr:ABC transporter substrate-binding protein [Bradyrhizobium yuanmingense]MDF0498203.1 ABC transporter substrate-binding protein [Bradyrhizobium yuanmingense]MDF0520157.1 ABC transporter substrate-binding protein [Bradyrhizobium yuanmingense]MDF0584205.1 ABC transporter substrate-binding protein [Bradyrhizobium yuanmingense]